MKHRVSDHMVMFAVFWSPQDEPEAELGEGESRRGAKQEKEDQSESPHAPSQGSVGRALLSRDHARAGSGAFRGDFALSGGGETR